MHKNAFDTSALVRAVGGGCNDPTVLIFPSAFEEDAMERGGIQMKGKDGEEGMKDKASLHVCE